MADKDLGKSIKLTQDTLGKHVKKPALSDKNLSRPPFRFLHDIVSSVISGTGFLKDAFTAEELDSNNISSREAKTEFMKKLISAVQQATGEEIPVKISKILAGQEPENTNLLLQSLARGIEKSRTNAASNKTSKPTPRTKGGAGAGRKDTSPVKPEKKPEPKSLAKADPKPTIKRGATEAPNKTSVGKNPEAAGASDKKDPRASTKKDEKPKVSSDSKGGGQGDAGHNEPEKSGTSFGRQNAMEQSKEGDGDASGPDTNRQKDQVENQGGKGDSLGTDLVKMHDDDASVLESSQLTKEASISDLTSLADPIDGNVTQDGFSSSVSQKGDAARTRRPSPPQPASSGFREEQSSDNVQSQSKHQFGPSTSRMGTARPPSARPAPPRPKSSLLRETEESNYRPPTGKVANVLLDNSADAGEEDDNFVIRENTGPGQLLDQLDEAPELALTSDYKFDGGAALEELAPEERGLLLNQILETQKELEKNTVKSDVEVDLSKQTSKAEIERLKNLLQDCARHSNPLGKLLDYVREDIDAMHKEVAKWREESKTLDGELENAKRTTESSLLPLQQQLTDIDARIADKQDAIAATKMSILRNQERIEKILSGLDRVQSNNSKKFDMPSASALLKSEPIKPSMLTLQDSFQQDEDQASFSRTFSATLNRVAQSTPGMRPVSLFSKDEDLDPDEFDPFKA